MNEGLVQFLVAAYKEQHYGRDENDREIILFKESILRKLKNSDQLNPVSPQYPISLNDFKSNYRSVAYNKGAYLFHMLRLEIGEVHFWAGLKHYSQTNWEKSVTSRQLQQAFESASGRKLDEFFDTWAYQPQKLQLSAKIKYLNSQLDIHFK